MFSWVTLEVEGTSDVAWLSRPYLTENLLLWDNLGLHVQRSVVISDVS